MLELNCYVRGDKPTTIFTIKIDTSETVGTLKEAIKARKAHTFHHIDASALDLWGVSIPFAKFRAEVEKFTWDEEQALIGGVLVDVFPDGAAEDRVHILISFPALDPPLNLTCYIRGSLSGSEFPVKINASESVDTLKDVIKEKKKDRFANVPTDELVLWKVSCSTGRGLQDAVEELKLDQDNVLCGSTILKELFSSPPERRKVDIVVAHLDSPLLLWCYVEGEKSHKVFPISIGKEKFVVDLKSTIARTMTTRISREIHLSSLTLWHVSVPAAGGLERAVEELELDDESPLLLAEILSDIFSTPPQSGHIHIVVRVGDSLGRLPLVKAREKVIRQAKRRAPSEQGDPKNFKAVQDHQITYHACVRPPERQLRIPFALLHPTFGQFIQDCKTIAPTDAAHRCVDDLHREMNLFYDQEEERAYAMRQILEDFGLNVQAGPILDTNYSTHGHILENSRPVLILEVKNELCSSKTDPLFQSCLYYRMFVDRAKLWTDGSSVLPCLIVTLTGPRLTFAGCAMTDRFAMETFSSVVLDYHRLNSIAHDEVARHLTALKAAHDTLWDQYSQAGPSDATQQALPDAPGSDEESMYQVFPYPTSLVPLDGGEQRSFTYQTKMKEGWTLLFKGKQGGQTICVKFVRRYGQDVHKWFSNQGLAPELLGFSELKGGWSMVVMEFLDKSWVILEDLLWKDQLTIEERGRLKENIRTALEQLHQHQMVHGDVRGMNIMVKKSEGVQFKFIDFDWAGRQEQVTYPPYMNSAVTRPRDVQFGAAITAQHDMFMLDRVFR